jgi:hypothetical protein
MKLLVIGHSVEDHINKEGADIIKPGGIFYTALTLKNFIEIADSFELNTYVQKENFELFSEVYNVSGNEYLTFVEKIPKVYLTLHDFKERGETYESISQSLNVETKKLSMFDGILINMITGFDISLEQLKEIRHNYGWLIYMDVHTLSRGLDENLKREFRPIPRFNEWASSVDIIQVNENELKTLSEINTTESGIVEEILNYNVKILIVTKGKTGAKVYTVENNEIISIFKSAIKIENKNMIGCGDVFGAVFFYTYIKSKNLFSSLKSANLAAGCAASYSDFNAFNNLKNDVLSRYN